MATVKHAIGEIDVVAFTEAIDKDEGTGRWPAGTEGTVVIDLGDHKMVEISNDRGETLDMPVVPVEKLKLITKYSNANAIRARSQKRRKPRRGTASPSSIA